MPETHSYEPPKYSPPTEENDGSTLRIKLGPEFIAELALLSGKTGLEVADLARAAFGLLSLAYRQEDEGRFVTFANAEGDVELSVALPRRSGVQVRAVRKRDRSNDEPPGVRIPNAFNPFTSPPPTAAAR